MNKKNSTRPVMYSSEEAERTLRDPFLTDALRASRNRELIVLQKELALLYQYFKTPLRIFDIGIGDGYVPMNFQRSLFAKIQAYIGIDNSPQTLQHCEKNIHEAELEEKVKLFEFDATRLSDKHFRRKFSLPFHVVVCTYFTPGNFRPDGIKLEANRSGQIIPYSAELLKPNKKFQKVFYDAYELLCKGGELILGSTYIDSEQTRLKQEAFYKKCGMHVITTGKNEFTATREGFWSERFTEGKIYSYLNWIERKNIKLFSLDAENFARMIVIKK